MTNEDKMYIASINASQMVLQIFDMGFISKSETIAVLDRILPDLNERDRTSVLCQVGDKQIISVDNLMSIYGVDYEAEREKLIAELEGQK